MLSVTALIWGRGVELSEWVTFPESCVHGTVYIFFCFTLGKPGDVSWNVPSLAFSQVPRAGLSSSCLPSSCSQLTLEVGSSRICGQGLSSQKKFA